VQTLEPGARTNAIKGSPKPDDPDWIETQQALERGDYGLFWEKCLAPLSRAIDKFFAIQNEFLKVMVAKMQAMQQIGKCIACGELS
jgi:hypothetical protein